MNIGSQILKIRKEKGLTQEEFEKYFTSPGRPYPTGKMRRAIRICRFL